MFKVPGNLMCSNCFLMRLMLVWWTLSSIHIWIIGDFPLCATISEFQYKTGGVNTGEPYSAQYCVLVMCHLQTTQFFESGASTDVSSVIWECHYFCNIKGNATFLFDSVNGEMCVRFSAVCKRQYEREELLHCYLFNNPVMLRVKLTRLKLKVFFSGWNFFCLA